MPKYLVEFGEGIILLMIIIPEYSFLNQVKSTGFYFASSITIFHISAIGLFYMRISP